MRFWIAKNNGVPVREQLMRQVLLGILSGELAVGQRLPSARTLARMHGIHANTVIAAFQELQDRGMLEARRGSGLYVRSDGREEAPGARLDSFLMAAIEEARQSGIPMEQVGLRLRQLAEAQPMERILVYDPEPELAEILCAELREAGWRTVARVAEPGAIPADALVVWLKHRGIPTTMAVTHWELSLRSIPGTIAGQERPAVTTTVTVLTASSLFWRGAQVYLAAVGIEGDRLRRLDPREAGWKERLDARGMLIVDQASAAAVPAGFGTKLFRVIADGSLEELRAKLPVNPSE